MQKTIRFGLFFTALFASISFSPLVDAKPINLACAQKSIAEYYHDLAPDSEFVKDVEHVVQGAELYLNERVAQNAHAASPAKLAMVLDIDETSLSNYPAIKAAGFADTKQQIEEHYHTANAPAIAPMLHLYKEAIEKGVAVFFITARKSYSNPSEDLRPYTITNLQASGFEGWTALYLPQGEDLKSSSVKYKTKIRKMITDQGYDIILSLGDQDSDLEGGYADHTVKVPNYLYTSSPCEAKSCSH